MSDNPTDRRSLLRQEGSDLSNAETIVTGEAISHRRGYARMSSQGSFEALNKDASQLLANKMQGDEQGLGISGAPQTINRVPVGGRTPSHSRHFTPITSSISSPQTPGSSQPFLSPSMPWQRYDTGDNISAGGLGPMEEQDIGRGKGSLTDSVDPAYEEDQQSRSIMNDGEYNDNKGILRVAVENHY